MTHRSAPHASRGNWPHVARDRLREPAATALAEGRGVLIVGDPGAGKSVLTEHIVEACGDAAVIWLRTPTALASPWSVLEPLIGRTDEVSQSADVLTRLVRRCQSALNAMDRPVVVLDDAHAIDGATAIVLSEVVNLGAARLVCNARRRPRAPSALFTLVRQRRLDQLEVDGFSLPEVHELLARALGGPVALETAHRAHDLTQGNALYLRELVRSLQASHRLANIGGAWVWPDQDEVGRGLIDLIGAELESLSSAERDIVDLLALAGPVAVEALGTVVEERALAAVLERGLVVLEPRSRDRVPHVRLVHPVHTEVLRGSLPPARRRRLYDWFHPESSTFASVDWSLTCGVTPDVDDMVSATFEAAAVANYPLVTRISDVALDVLAEEDPRALSLLLVRAQVARYEGNADATTQNLERAGPLIPAGIDGDTARLRHARIAADLAQFGDDDVDAAIRITHGANLTDPLVLAMRDADRFHRLAYAGRFGECLDELERYAEEQTDPGIRSVLVGSRILGGAQAGRLNHALALADESLMHWRLDPGRYPLAMYELVAARTLAAL